MQRKATNLKFETIIFAAHLIVIILQPPINKFYFSKFNGLIKMIVFACKSIIRKFKNTFVYVYKFFYEQVPLTQNYKQKITDFYKWLFITIKRR